jgi:hypothetical protein
VFVNKSIWFGISSKDLQSIQNTYVPSWFDTNASTVARTISKYYQYTQSGGLNEKKKMVAKIKYKNSIYWSQILLEMHDFAPVI